MGMFTSYQQALVNSYQPNNLSKSFSTPLNDSKLDPQSSSKPFELYNVKGELIGYTWNYGETLKLDFEIEGCITVEPDAVIYTTTGLSPDVVGLSAKVGTRLYNITDLRSWTCLGKHFDEKTGMDRYMWEEDSDFMYPETREGVTLKQVYVPAAKYLSDKTATVTLYDFRMEPVYTWTFENASRIVCDIDKDVSKRIVRGTYKCSVVVENTEVSFTVFHPSDCELLVK